MIDHSKFPPTDAETRVFVQMIEKDGQGCKKPDNVEEQRSALTELDAGMKDRFVSRRSVDRHCILSLPIGLFGSFLFLQQMGLSNDVYAQIGLVMLVGLLGKNAILIIEFAVQRRRAGASLKEAGIEAAKHCDRDRVCSRL